MDLAHHFTSTTVEPPISPTPSSRGLAYPLLTAGRRPSFLPVSPPPRSFSINVSCPSRPKNVTPPTSPPPQQTITAEDMDGLDVVLLLPIPFVGWAGLGSGWMGGMRDITFQFSSTPAYGGSAKRASEWLRAFLASTRRWVFLLDWGFVRSEFVGVCGWRECESCVMSIQGFCRVFESLRVKSAHFFSYSYLSLLGSCVMWCLFLCSGAIDTFSLLMGMGVYFMQCSMGVCRLLCPRNSGPPVKKSTPHPRRGHGSPSSSSALDSCLDDISPCQIKIEM